MQVIMSYPIQINFLHMSRSPALEQSLRERAEKLAQFHPAISGCTVTVEPEGKHSRQGIKYNVRVDVKVKGKEFAITRHAQEDAFVAGRDAFDTAQRQLHSELEARRDEAQRGPDKSQLS
jgi:ribosome-associated translation inhibitor RaiA